MTLLRFVILRGKFLSSKQKIFSPAVKIRRTFAAENLSKFFFADLIVTAGPFSLITLHTAVNKCSGKT